jgi:hypothetical protein
MLAIVTGLPTGLKQNSPGKTSRPPEVNPDAAGGGYVTSAVPLEASFSVVIESRQ